MISTPFVRWWLGIDAIPADAGNLRLAFERPLPAWGWLLVIACAAALAWLSYRALDVPPRRRVFLGCLRAATVLLLAVLAAGPVLELPRERREPDTVIVLADRSRSMEVADVTYSDQRMTRDAVLRELLTGPNHVLSDAGDAHRVLWYGFAESLVPLQVGPQGVQVGDAVGDRTLLATTLEQAVARAGGRPISAVVLMTDGRTTDPPDPALLRRLADDGVQVISVAIGADEPLGDLAVVQSQAPRRAFAKDLVPVEATIERRGPATLRGARVQLVDTATGMVLDQTELQPGAGEG
ncbi:MAG: VWA domain-containing protein, partial [Phycisphaerae bacterium]|nr:VWA domain-containing protein [Phycisphaerae bacterium]